MADDKEESKEIEVPEGFTELDSEIPPEPSDPEKEWIEHEGYEWLTETDKEILGVMMSKLTLNPAIIAENIDRSRAGVSRRLNALNAGGLVEKVDRGKYKITDLGAGFYFQGNPAESEDESDLE